MGAFILIDIYTLKYHSILYQQNIGSEIIG